MKSSLPLIGESLKPPGEDEFEISLFGPGVGECVVVHLGYGQWVVVDSCCPVGSTEPVALSYFTALGIAAGNAVRLVVATHWHTDHIRGMAKLLEVCEQAEFVCSGALESKTFVKLITALDQRPMMESSGVDEFHRIFGVLRARAATGRATPKWAIADRRLHEDLEAGIEVRSLSPSDAAKTLALREIGHLIPREGATKGRLETSANAAVGWTAVVNSRLRPPGQGRFFKVPHHGSPDADHPRVWSEMLIPQPVAALTQFASGTRPLPSPADVRRLAARTNQLYCTGPPDGWKAKAKNSAVEKTLRDAVRNLRAITGPMGHVRLRTSLRGDGDPVTVFLGNGASNLAA